MPTDRAAAPPGSPGLRPWMLWVALGSLIALILLIGLQPAVRALAADTWHQMRGISPTLLGLIVACKVAQALLASLSWRNALNTAWPDARLSYPFVVGIDQGQDIANAIVPGRAGTWAMLGMIGMSIRGAGASKLLTVWGVHNLAFLLFSSVAYLLIAIGLPTQSTGREGPLARLGGAASAQPVLAAVLTGAILSVLVLLVVRGRRRVAQGWRQAREGLAILGTPGRYLRLLFLPALGSYLCRCAAYGLMLTAFDIPVTVWTLALALGSQAVSGAVRLTPGGVGTNQALDVVALSPYAAPEVITAYSLSDIAISFLVNIAVAVVALLVSAGWDDTREMAGHLRRGQLRAGLHRLGTRQRGPRTATRRRGRRHAAAALPEHAGPEPAKDEAQA